VSGLCDAFHCWGSWWPSGPLAKGNPAGRFDRGGKLYTVRVKALADAAREAGLLFLNAIQP